MCFRKMLKVILLSTLGIFFIAINSWALSNCSSSGYKHNCFGKLDIVNRISGEIHKYEGDIQHNEAHGKGTIYYSDGGKYVGELKDNKKHGQGMWNLSNGGKYIGEFKDGKMNGKGTFISIFSASTYIGEFKNNEYDGLGIKTYENGNIKEGIWKKNRFMRSQKIKKKHNKHNIGHIEINDSNLCSYSSINGKWRTANYSQKFVKEAKRRGLDCGVNDNDTTIASNQTKNPTNRPLATVSDSTVCFNATITSGNTKIWNIKNDNFVGEAKYRNLTCGVKVIGQFAKVMKMDDESICSFAITNNGSYEKRSSYLPFVNEAKRRGLDCSLENKAKTVISSNALEQEKQKRIALQKKADEEERKRKELERKLAALEKKQKEQQQIKPKPVVAKKPKSEFPLRPIPINFPSVSVKRDDIAVIIGNANYKKMGKDIPNVNPAYADAEGIKQYFMKAKGIKEGNIIYLKDATGSQLLGVFGNEKSHKGKLFNYIKPNKSNVYVYYAGHGAPGEEGDAYLVPTDTDSQTIEFTGYPLSTLYSNLGKLPAKSMTVILEACFSGGSQSGSLISKASPIVIQPKKTMIPENIKVIAAGSERQMASWEEDSSHSLFTKYFLKAMSGEGDSNKDGKVSDTELREYLSDTMTYYARRYYGRDQKVQIHNGG